MKLLSEKSTYECNNKCYVIYEDKEVDIEESCEKGENTIEYDFHRRNSVVTHHVGPEDNTSIFTTAYFEYIDKYKTIPMFKCSPEAKHGLEFKVNNSVMKFVAEIPEEKNTYCLNLEEFGVYIFEKGAIDSDPYQMEKELLLEIHTTVDEKYLFIIDYKQYEFYAVDSKYHQIISGKLDIHLNVVDYIQDGERYMMYYDTNGIISRINTFSGIEDGTMFRRSRYSKELDETVINVTYLVPYVITSYGVVLTNKDNRLYKTQYITKNPDEYDIETKFSSLNKEDIESMIAASKL